MDAKKLPNKNLPATKYIVRHDKGDAARTRPCVHFITFGEDYGEAKVVGFHVIIRLNLTGYLPPPQKLCERFTGQSRELAKSFFSIDKNEAAFREALDQLRYEIREEMRRNLKGRCIAFVINCTLGRHRSVAMAERLAETVGRWGGYRSECLHLDLSKVMDEKAQAAVRVDFTQMSRPEPAQGRMNSRDKVQAISGIWVDEVRTRGAPLGKKTAAGRSANRWEELDNRKTLPP